ncbi:MAG: TauD/TfdA dioxygenase family protein, partial [Burkholderiales bacterium]
VLVIRGQKLEPADFLGFAARFGELKPHLVKKSHHPHYPELMVMDNRIIDVKKNVEEANAPPLLVKLGAVWHTDLSYEYVTAKATGMHALAVPSTGGDTPFSNMYTAYETLSEKLKNKIEGLSASYKYGGRGKRQLERLEDADRDRAPALHPLVQVHPETGRKILYFNGGQVIDILGVDADESDVLIAQLKAHTESADGDYRHKWQAGDVVIWDNRCSIHTATGDYPVNERRTMWRTTVMNEGWQRRARSA